ncbi:MAG: DKNYY domain-containing protein [Ferruginibacter sp.]
MFALLVGVIKFLFGCGNLLLHPGYNIRGNKVLYKNAFPAGSFEVENADAKTFKVVDKSNDQSNTGFATDKNYVFYSGSMIQGSDGKSFTYINLNFSKDKNQCYYKAEVIPGADPASFNVKADVFSADKNHIYKHTTVVDNDPSVFESFDSSRIVRTANAVSVFGKIIPLEKSTSFKHFRFNFYAINEQVYFQNDSLWDADAASFKVLTEYFAVSNKHVYYGERLVKNADPKTFKPLAAPYGKDAAHVFFFERTIEGADPKTFEILNTAFQCSRDKNTAYHEDKPIKNITVEDMANKKKCNQCNASAIYFEEK